MKKWLIILCGNILALCLVVGIIGCYTTPPPPIDWSIYGQKTTNEILSMRGEPRQVKYSSVSEKKMEIWYYPIYRKEPKRGLGTRLGHGLLAGTTEGLRSIKEGRDLPDYTTKTSYDIQGRPMKTKIYKTNKKPYTPRPKSTPKFSYWATFCFIDGKVAMILKILPNNRKGYLYIDRTQKALFPNKDKKE